LEVTVRKKGEDGGNCIITASPPVIIIISFSITGPCAIESARKYT